MIHIETKDKKQVLILEDKDAVDLIRDYISDELADYISARLVEFDETEYRNAQEFASDYHAIEGENEEYRNELFEIQSVLQQLSCDLESGKKIPKSKVIERLDALTEHIQKVL